MARFACVAVLLAQMSSHLLSALARAPPVTLATGAPMPSICFGTYLGWEKESGPVRPANREVYRAVRAAAAAGYRCFDTAPLYGTEREVGEALAAEMKSLALRREDLFVITKLWNTDHKEEDVIPALRRSLANLGLEYVDLYLIHWPVSLNADYTLADVELAATWRGAAAARRAGLARALGVSNCNAQQLARLMADGGVAPHVLQTEVHPHLTQSSLVAYAQQSGVTVMGYSPLGPLVPRYGLELPEPRHDNPYLVSLGKKYGKSTYQIVLRWLVDRNIVPVVKTLSPARMAENIDVFKFNLTKDEVDQISRFNIDRRYTLPSFWQDSPEYPFEKVDNPIEDPFIKLYNENKLLVD